MSQTTLRKVRRASKKITNRNLTPEEAQEGIEITRTINARRWEVAQIRGNTALVPNGQALADQLEAVVALLDDVWKQWIYRKLEACGYPNGTKCSVNLSTGEITTQNEPGND